MPDSGRRLFVLAVTMYHQKVRDIVVTKHRDEATCDKDLGRPGYGSDDRAIDRHLVDMMKSVLALAVPSSTI